MAAITKTPIQIVPAPQAGRTTRAYTAACLAAPYFPAATAALAKHMGWKPRFALHAEIAAHPQAHGYTLEITTCGGGHVGFISTNPLGWWITLHNRVVAQGSLQQEQSA